MELNTDPKQLQTLAEGNGGDWGRRFKALKKCAGTQFGRISLMDSNENVLLRTLGDEGLRKALVGILEAGERDWNYDARTDSNLKNLVTGSGGKLPKDEGDQGRWALLVAAAAATVEGFSYGNVIRSEDLVREK